MTLIRFANPDSRMQSASYKPEFGEFVNSFLNSANRYAHECSSMPAVNIIEEPTAFRLQLAAPGYTRTDFDIKVENDLLIISSKGAGKSETETKYIRNEFGFEPFTRTFNMGKSVDSSKVEARYENGILEVTLQKREEAIPRPPQKIEVN
jgi:HSP20 family protein